MGDCLTSNFPVKKDLRKVVNLHIRVRTRRAAGSGKGAGDPSAASSPQHLLSHFSTQDALRVDGPRGSPPPGDALARGGAATDLVTSRGVRAASVGLDDPTREPLARSMADGTVATWDVIEYPLAHRGAELARCARHPAAHPAAARC